MPGCSGCTWPITQAEQSFPSENLPSEFPAQSWLRPFPKLHLGPLSFLCQQLSPSTQPGRGLFSERPARWPKKTACFPLACQGMTALCCPPAACSPNDVHTSCLTAGDTGEAQQFPAQAPRPPPPHDSCSLSWSHGRGSSRPGVWRLWSNLCARGLGKPASRK